MNNEKGVKRNEDIIYILWTGGWDSTYRMIELSRMDTMVQPIYLLDEERASYEYELKAISVIEKMLMTRAETKAEILPVKILRLSDLPEDQKITDTVKMLISTIGWGTQNDWLARIALLYPGIEMCIEKIVGEYSPTRTIINKYGSIRLGSHGYVVTDDSDDVLKTVLGNITLPIFELTETDMAENIKKWGYEDVMRNIWFCHSPINGEPCGMCTPCHTKWDNNMKFLLPKNAMRHADRIDWTKRHFGQFGFRAYRKMAKIFPAV